MSELSPDLEDFVQRIFAASRIRVQINALSWPGGGGDIQRLSAELDSLDVNLSPYDRLPMEGLYRGFEEFSDVWVLGEADPKMFALTALDFLAREVTQDACEASTWCAMLSIYGADVIPLMEAELRAALATLGTEYRRLVSEAPRDDDDDGTEEINRPRLGPPANDPEPFAAGEQMGMFG